MSKTDFRTPLGRARGLGSAHHGVETFILERSTSVALVPLSLWAVYAGIKVAPLGYDNAVLLLRQPVNAILALLLMTVSFVHMRAGLKVVIEDYIHTPTGKVVALMGNAALTWLGWAVSSFAILWVAFTGGPVH
jgi:succinate dehydrogenase / fumarate reductase membrane anchor subunit